MNTSAYGHLLTLTEFALVLETTDKEQGFGSMEKFGKYCALGAAQLHGEDATTINNRVCALTGMTVVHMNDTLRWNFKRIATLIREKLDEAKPVCNLA